MYTTIDSFIRAWDNDAAGMQRVMDTLTDASLKQEVSPHDRTLGRVAWHIVYTIYEMMEKSGLTLAGAIEEAPVPETAEVIALAYRKANESLADALRQQWSDTSLQEEVNLYGEPWTKAIVLNVLIHHQIHHRGQMTVLMRQAGLRVPGVFGPSREEWSTFGVEAPSV
ncbi:putative damage-inducible protein DinB [Aneurinibacillus soli]|uniref:DinB family protein n=1 Tax=Aneurinibacillus soli TaxID=1500254 RepID=A0A0U5BC78_9BACL|nr:DinB family protein [Aneurinibacillus soli]PYE59448.1 putative damage-inducible protein DinB [Aneurinibacillus soli]BAU29222.1 DinB family protein [Aneurinibacillus soli]